MNRIVFIVIGFIEYHKGQDVLINAIKNIDEKKIKKCDFLLVGRDNSLYAQDLHKMMEGMDNVKFAGVVDRTRIHRMLEDADVLICPSREDSMPTVCAEAMMHGVPCIVSDATGTARYIEDEFNGFVFTSENVDELSAKICWCIENEDKLKEMGEKAYEIYDKYFSMKAFESNLLFYVENMMGKDAAK